MALKFDDCVTCRFRRKPAICAECDVGECFEDEDAPTVDMAFREATTRERESVTDDEIGRFDAHRFADSLEDQDESDDDENA